MTKRDINGVPYSSPGQGPAHYGTPITIHTTNGPIPGTMGSGQVIPKK